MLLQIFKSFRKSYKLKRVYRRLATAKNKDFLDLYLNDLIEIMESDENVSYVMNLYGIDNITIKLLFTRLSLIGAGRYAGGHYVAAATFAYAYSLKFVLDAYDGEKFSVKEYDEKNSGLYVANRLITYFANGESGEL